LSRHFWAALVGAACTAGVAADASAQAAAAPLTRAEALARALSDDPNIAAAAAAERAADAGVAQAGRWANPTLNVLRENVSGSGVYSGDARAETTYALSQPLQLGGDRRARRDLAARERDAARIGADIRRLDLVEAVEHAFIDAQAAASALGVAEERRATARDLAESAERRVRAARDPLMAGARAEARLVEAEVDLETARREAHAARARLATHWGGDGAFALETASFEQTPEAVAAVRAAPDLALAAAQAERAEARIDLERARAFPDVDVQAGWRQFRENDETALLFGVSVPLSLWDRNQGGVARARAERAMAGYELAARERALMREHSMLQTQLETSRLEVEALDARVIPLSEQALERARDGYAQGAFSYLDVFEAQRALSDARLRRISALRSYHRAQASLARLSGARAEELTR
jgi:cobalt-zinc-cadmium efflux system outer membrane protein